MSSSRLVLIFLGIILMIIVILTSNKLATALKSRLGNGFAGLKFSAAETTPTPTPLSTTKGGLINPTSTPVNGKQQYPVVSGSNTSQSPATGPEEVAYILIGGSAGIGYLLTKFSSRG